MNIRVRKIIAYRTIASLLLLISLGLTSFCLYKVIVAHPENIVLDLIALSLTLVFSIAQIIFILRGKKKESHLLDIAFNTDGTINKVFLVFVLVGTAVGLGLDILTIVILCTRLNTVSVFCSMHIIMAISSYLLLNCFIYIAFCFLFKKRELTLEDYAK